MGNRRAFTIVELLVAIAILLLLLALLLPVLSGAKSKARQTSGTSNMRQLGQAGILYSEQFGEMPLGCPALVQTQLVPKALCSGANDTSTEGIANRFAQQHATVMKSYNAVVTPYKNSFLGWHEVMTPLESLQKQLSASTSQGWLVDMSSAAPSEPFGLWWKGSYRRLTLDGAVVSKQTREVMISVGEADATGFAMITLFGDFPKDWKP
jgi:prepilin-type N-terminal cleavage/methylation domain-containing protein